jgi:diguanylate cyclase (GGDEF)-like protein/PAS domain S-box-containing protein
MSTIILGLSVALQYIAAIISLYLIKVTGKWRAWSFIAIGLLLMGVRRTITLYHSLTETNAYTPITTAEIVGLAISSLMLIGVIMIIPIFKKIQSTNKELLFRKFSIDHADSEMFWLNSGLHFIDVNDAMCKMLGYTREELLDMHIADIDIEFSEQQLEKWNHQKNHLYESTYKTKDGVTIPVDVSVNNFDFEGNKNTFVFVNNISSRKEANNNLLKLTDQLKKNNEVILELTKKDFADLSTAFKEIITVDAEQLNINRVSVWLFNDDHTEIICQCLYQGGEIIEHNGLVLNSTQYPSYFDALEQNIMLSAIDAHTDPRTSEFSENYLTPLDIYSMMDVPIRLQGSMIGIVCHESIGQKKEWSVQDEDFATSISEMCALSLQENQRKETEMKLRESEKRLREAQRMSQIGNWYWHVDTGLVEWSEEVYKIFQLDPVEFTPQIDSIMDMSPWPEESKRLKATVEKAIANREPGNFEQKFQRQDGSIGYYFSTFKAIFDDDDNIKIMKGTIQDISHRKKIETELKNREERIRLLLDSTAEAIFGLDENGNCTFCNASCIRMLGYEVQEDLLGKNMHNLIHHTRTDGTPYPFQECHIHKSIVENKSAHIDSEILFKKDGSSFPAEYWSHPILLDGDTLGTVVTFLDITDRKQADDLLNYQASHDNLTGLINRREFERRSEKLLDSVKQDDSKHALCFMDLDQFKVVNDSCGHIAGDELLRQLSSLLLKVVRKRDTLARLGGDEFGVLMEHCSLDDAHRVATSLQKAIQEYLFLWEGQTFKIGVSIGLVPISNTTANLTELLKHADAACYMAKDSGRNRIQIYHAEDSEIAQRHGEMQWVTRIHKAIEDNRFCLFAQSIESLGARKSLHYELLLRMLDEQGKAIAPGVFLPAAERYNLISKIDRWVIESAFRILSKNPGFLKKIDYCSINLSGQSLTHPEILNFIIEQLNQSEVGGYNICFEITETAAISNLNKATEFISTLKSFGCRFALDDFGSGLSSFAYLKNLPVDYLKIDGMFVKDIADDPIDRAMVKSINEIGQVMGMSTIAEFVENDIIKGMLKEIGVNYAQGYGISKPQPIDEILVGTSNIIDIKASRK